MSDTPMQEFWVGRGADRLGEHLGRGIFHYDQDEWFYVVEGEYVFEVGQERIRLKPGDSVFGARKAPHVWAFVSDQPGRILFVFTPAGQMEAFFREPSKADVRPPQDPAYYLAYGMELVRPPLAIE